MPQFDAISQPMVLEFLQVHINEEVEEDETHREQAPEEQTADLYGINKFNKSLCENVLTAKNIQSLQRLLELMVAENKEHKKMLSAVSEATSILNEQIDSINKDLAVDSLEILLKETLKKRIGDKN